MAHVWDLYAGVHVVTCTIHGYLGAAIHMARAEADHIEALHNLIHHHLEEERRP